jgi:hypothetical protein
MISYGLLDILRQRPGQPGFHIASEKAVRIEFMRFVSGQELGPFKIDGDAVVTCLEGAFAVGVEQLAAAPLTQFVVPQGEIVQLRCTSVEGAVQIIWAPPFAAATPG